MALTLSRQEIRNGVAHKEADGRNKNLQAEILQVGT
jgi:hypothetical protein